MGNREGNGFCHIPCDYSIIGVVKTSSRDDFHKIGDK